MANTEKQRIPEIEILRACVESSKLELSVEKQRIEEIVEEETIAFFSRYSADSYSSKIFDDFKNELTKIYRNKISKKSAFLKEIDKKIGRIETIYFEHC